MGTTTDKLSYLTGTEEKLAEKIIDLGGDITDNTTFREYANELQTIYDNADKVSAEGTDITLNNMKKGKMVIQPKGNTIQNDGASLDNPQTIKNVTGNNKVKISGKNLFDIKSVTWGVFKYYSNNAISTLNITNAFYKYQSVIPEEKISISIKNSARAFRASYAFIDENDNVLSGVYKSSSSQTQTFENLTVPTNASQILISQIDCMPTDEIEIQLEKGTTQTEYEPYIGPIEKELNLKSKNLFEIKDFDETITYSGLTLNLKFEKSKLILNGSTVARSYSITSPVKYNGNYVNTLTEVPTFNLKSGTYTLSVQNIKNAPSNAYLIGMRITNGVKQGIRSY